MIDLVKSVGPYVGVSKDETKTYKNGRTLRFVLYGAYNAFGLIGSENNGIAILDEDNFLVVCDEIGKETTGCFGPSKNQQELFDAILDLSWVGLMPMLKTDPRTRQMP